MKAILKVSTLNTPQHINFVLDHRQELEVLTAREELRRAMQQERTEEEEEGMGRSEKCRLLPIYPLSHFCVDLYNPSQESLQLSRQFITNIQTVYKKALLQCVQMSSIKSPPEMCPKCHSCYYHSWDLASDMVEMFFYRMILQNLTKKCHRSRQVLFSCCRWSGINVTEQKKLLEN